MAISHNQDLPALRAQHIPSTLLAGRRCEALLPLKGPLPLQILGKAWIMDGAFSTHAGLVLKPVRLLPRMTLPSTWAHLGRHAYMQVSSPDQRASPVRQTRCRTPCGELTGTRLTQSARH